MDPFQAFVVDEFEEAIRAQVSPVTRSDLSPGEVFIRVAYSSLNYKDMLATQKKAGVIRHYPMIPGIDVAGTVVESHDPAFSVGQEVLATGYQLGMSHTGGLAEYVQLPAKWLIPLPQGLDLRQSMVYGTAGLTAGLSISALEQAGLTPRHAPRILVTGANGGVGSLAIQLLKKAGYTTIDGFIRKPEHADYVTALGATPILPTTLYPSNEASRPLQKPTYDYILDTVGGPALADLLAKVAPNGALSCCGNAAGLSFTPTVLPFILRGVSLLGIDSVEIPLSQKKAIWQRLATDWALPTDLEVEEIGLTEVPEVIEKLRLGHHQGRTIVKL